MTFRWDLALWLLGLRPDAVCINAACTACERQLRWRQALRLAGSEFAASAAWRRAKVAELSEDQPQAAAVQDRGLKKRSKGLGHGYGVERE